MSSRLVFPEGRTWAAPGAPLRGAGGSRLGQAACAGGWAETAMPEHGPHLFLRAVALEEPGGCSTTRGPAGFVARAARRWYQAQGRPAPGNANQGLAAARPPANTGNETKQSNTLPTGLPPPYHVIAQLVPLTYQRGEPPVHTVMAF